jgi:hypothetical protein
MTSLEGKNGNRVYYNVERKGVENWDWGLVNGTMGNLLII